jgi:hypothetical protein
MPAAADSGDDRDAGGQATIGGPECIGWAYRYERFQWLEKEDKRELGLRTTTLASQRQEANE